MRRERASRKPQVIQVGYNANSSARSARLLGAGSSRRASTRPCLTALISPSHHRDSGLVRSTFAPRPSELAAASSVKMAKRLLW